MEPLERKMRDLIGQRVEIELYVTDGAMSYRRGPYPRPIPQLPKIQGKLIKRVLVPYGSWSYIAQLNEPLALDCEGIGEKARALYSTAFLLIVPDSNTSNFNKDSIFEKLSQGKASDSIVSAVKDPDKIPSEIAKDDPAWENFPSISSGIVRLLP